MCIASFVKSESELIVTFNRDEDISREFHAPHLDAKTGVFSPVDELAGGTWIGLKGDYIMCLQNGGRKKHVRNVPYQQSRGMMLKKMLETGNVDSSLAQLAIVKTEPFTLSVVNITNAKLSVFYYNGMSIEHEGAELETPQIILSSTLYDKNTTISIVKDFKSLEDLHSASILDFHRRHVIPMPDDRSLKALATSSITQFVISGYQNTCTFVDLVKDINAKYIL